jgi:hypothetical protein
MIGCCKNYYWIGKSCLVKNFLERFSLALEAKERNLIVVDERVVKVNGYRCFFV